MDNNLLNQQSDEANNALIPTKTMNNPNYLNLCSIASVRILATILFTAFSLSSDLKGAVLYDTLENTPIGGTDIVNNSDWTANSFTTTSSAYILDTLELKLRKNAGSTGDYRFDIYTSTGSQPQTFVSTLATKSAADLSTSFTTVSVSGINLTLSTSTEYFLVLRGVSLTDSIHWAYKNGNSGADYANTTNSGSTWSTPGFDPNNFKLTAVPEPKFYALISSLALLGFFFQRKKFRATTNQ